MNDTILRVDIGRLKPELSVTEWSETWSTLIAEKGTPPPAGPVSLVVDVISPKYVPYSTRGRVVERAYYGLLNAWPDTKLDVVELRVRAGERTAKKAGWVVRLVRMEADDG